MRLYAITLILNCFIHNRPFSICFFCFSIFRLIILTGPYTDIILFPGFQSGILILVFILFYRNLICPFETFLCADLNLVLNHSRCFFPCQYQHFLLSLYLYRSFQTFHFHHFRDNAFCVFFRFCTRLFRYNVCLAATAGSFRRLRTFSSRNLLRFIF